MPDLIDVQKLYDSQVPFKIYSSFCDRYLFLNPWETGADYITRLDREQAGSHASQFVLKNQDGGWFQIFSLEYQRNLFHGKDGRIYGHKNGSEERNWWSFEPRKDQYWIQNKKWRDFWAVVIEHPEPSYYEFNVGTHKTNSEINDFQIILCRNL